MEVEPYDLGRLLLLLDASQEALDAAAAKEERAERGKRMRAITHQKRAKTARETVAAMCKKYYVDIGA